MVVFVRILRKTFYGWLVNAVLLSRLEIDTNPFVKVSCNSQPEYFALWNQTSFSFSSKRSFQTFIPVLIHTKEEIQSNESNNQSGSNVSSVFCFVLSLAQAARIPPNNAALLLAIDATRPGVNAWQQPQNKYWWTNVKAQFGRIFGIKYRIGAHELWHCPENQSRVRSSAVSMGGDTTQRCWRKLLVPEALQPWSLANHSDTLAVFQKPL